MIFNVKKRKRNEKKPPCFFLSTTSRRSSSLKYSTKGKEQPCSRLASPVLLTFKSEFSSLVKFTFSGSFGSVGVLLSHWLAAPCFFCLVVAVAKVEEEEEKRPSRLGGPGAQPERANHPRLALLVLLPTLFPLVSTSLSASSERRQLATQALPPVPAAEYANSTRQLSICGHSLLSGSLSQWAVAQVRGCEVAGPGLISRPLLSGCHGQGATIPV